MHFWSSRTLSVFTGLNFQKTLLLMEKRLHHRARIGLPVRVRCITPFGVGVESAMTADVSRGGFSFDSPTRMVCGIHVWTSLPFDASIADAQPDLRARIVHCHGCANGMHRIGVQFETPSLHLLVSQRTVPPGIEHRISPRHFLNVPVRVRPDYLPWPEETMTLNISEAGIRFLTTRQHEEGSILLLEFDKPSPATWPAAEEVQTIIVRREIDPANGDMTVAVCRLGAQTKSRLHSMLQEIVPLP